MDQTKNDAIKIERLTPNDGGHYFFGYYDKKPCDKSGNLFLAHKVNFIDKLPKNGELADICVIDLKNGNKLEKIAESRAWNWQMGSMLQWLGPDFGSKVIFNDLLGGKFVSVIYDLNSNFGKAVDFPVYAIHPSGKSAVSLNFSRLSKLREGYGYWGLENNLKNLGQAPADDGIYSVDLENNKTRLIMPFRQISELNHSGIMDKGSHWVEHMAFNPAGNRFAFIHRFQLENNRVYSRLISVSADGFEPRVLLDTGMASHFCWKNNEEILIWGRAASFARKMEKRAGVLKYLIPVYHAVYNNLKFLKNFLKQKVVGDCFLLIKDLPLNLDKNNIKKIGEGILNEDGHCTFSPDGEWIICDSYPDKNHFRNLFVYNFKTGERKNIGRFNSLPNEKFKSGYAGDWNKWDLSGMRCDLHPRWLNGDKPRICFDSVHEGSRQIYIYDFKN